jgi:hypothetical protein
MDWEKHWQIAARAYALWQSEGQPDGRHEEHWHRAVREIAAGKPANSAVSAPRGGKGAKRQNVCG